MSNQIATVHFSGLVTGFVGLLQVNPQVPPNAPVGDDGGLQVLTGGQFSDTVTVAIR